MPTSEVGDIWFSKANYSIYKHNHVGMYIAKNQIIEAPGAGKVVQIRNVSKYSASKGDQILLVNSKPKGKTRLSYNYRKQAIDWAKRKKGADYAYTLNNKACGNNDYNCSQLVWCAYKKTGSKLDLDSDGTWFVSPNDILGSNRTYSIWRY